ncbi:DsbA family protein [Allocoleopsis franciscana]|uniref:Protein-disulfide isomerase n=1 Tax=Allocoleopsis franciscana PCC 7113 TaxID=1173027 RepID=K9W930_9CYAN|nr:thioredoxin domain-containing protein [Allocoleopsis franciscana]AFZ16269.1 protein-disulfide isomerase [Allocoleopsis franciscana PCC 7113]
MYRSQLLANPFISLRRLAQKALALAGLLLSGLVLLTWSLPAQAASQVSPLVEEQVLQVIRKHPEQILQLIREHPEVIVQSVQGYQQQQQSQLQQIRQAFVQALQMNPKIVIRDSPTTGASDLKVVLLEFSDFQCPYCAQAHKIIQQFMSKHADEVTLVYKHFPLTPIHPEAMPAAKAAWAAFQQGKFWEYEDALFSQQDKLGNSLYVATAKSLNLDLEKFEQDQANADRAIEEDIQLAQTLGLSGTPFFVINGEAFSGDVKLSDLEKALTGASQS